MDTKDFHLYLCITRIFIQHFQCCKIKFLKKKVFYIFIQLLWKYFNEAKKRGKLRIFKSHKNTFDSVVSALHQVMFTSRTKTLYGSSNNACAQTRTNSRTWPERKQQSEKGIKMRAEKHTRLPKTKHRKFCVRGNKHTCVHTPWDYEIHSPLYNTRCANWTRSMRNVLSFINN